LIKKIYAVAGLMGNDHILSLPTRDALCSVAYQLSADAFMCRDDGGRSGLVGGGRVCAAHGESPQQLQLRSSQMW